MPRPLPTLPRGPRRRRPERDWVLLACPRVAPDWELGALKALMKPQAGGAIRHRWALQEWPADAAERVEAARQAVVSRLGFDPLPHLPDAGDYRLAADVPATEIDAARAFALLLSRGLPGVWFVVDRLFVRDGRFYRRGRGYKLDLVEAGNVHLPRPVRAALRGIL